MNAVDLLAAETGCSKQKIKQAMQKGAVWISDGKGTRRLRRKSQNLKQGSTLHFYFDESVLEAIPVNAILIADEGAYSVWYKPRGMLSQGSKWGDHCAINRWVELNVKPERPAFTIHRLDRFASGLILLAHKKKTAAQLAALFEEKNIVKQYKVIVSGQFPDKKITFDNAVEGKAATSHVTLLDYDREKDRSLVRVEIESGRKHQIRRHLSDAGFPVVGDRQYGTGKDEGDLQLTAFSLSFICPLTGMQKNYILPESLQPKL